MLVDRVPHGAFLAERGTDFLLRRGRRMELDVFV